ncbi:ABC transporter ATP-binding protein [Chitinibacter sp. ZOR0017]|uniref:ABC transporter ATP-binding protein n=1 Tax=Chitinibacter sp. ZOR0017 TaxID=1339254 RepID=UPI000690C53F|nr:ABC transporter ATP-binding protein [Chitinibacter sp. ZOR0017]
MTTNAIQLDFICKTYSKGLTGKVKALDQINLNIEHGEAFGFIGANGAGKSTTIKIITGALRANSGKATIDGCDASSPKARVGLGYVPESPYLYDYLTPLEILRMGIKAHNSKLDSHSIEVNCKRWLEKFEIAHVANKTIRSFSKGMIQRTALAHALAINPKLLILDEPLSGLDPLGRQLVINCLAEYKATGGTLFFSSHVLHDVERLADRFALIHQGQIKKIGKTSESNTSYTITYNAPTSNQTKQLICGPDNLWTTLEKLKLERANIIELHSKKNLEEQFIEITKNENH